MGYSISKNNEAESEKKTKTQDTRQTILKHLQTRILSMEELAPRSEVFPVSEIIEIIREEEIADHLENFSEAPKSKMCIMSKINSMPNFSQSEGESDSQDKISPFPYDYSLYENTPMAFISEDQNERSSDFFFDPPHDLSDFTIIKTIGKGTFGKVILVQSKIYPHNYFAIKYFSKINILKNKYAKQIIREKKVLEKFNHPFVVKLYKTFQNEEKIFMLFEYCNGGEIFFHLQHKTRFSEQVTRIYAAQLYLALSYLHSQKVLYRDLKPENIMLDDKGNLKLIDFGLVKDNFNPNSPVWSICGTTEYIPPEVIKGDSYGTSFDWWGFGIFIYEMLVGVPPFISDNKTLLFKKIVYTEPNYSFLDYEKVEVSDEAKNLITLLLDKNPKNRIKPEDIPKHKWFIEAGINFDDVLSGKVQSLFNPDTQSPDDVKNFDPEFLKESCFSPNHKIKPEVEEFVNRHKGKINFNF